MKTKDLKELAEMTGLSVESNKANAVTHQTNANASDSANRQHVGTFAKVGNNYGMIDDVTPNGFGFVYSCEDGSWVGRLVDTFRTLANEDEIALAKASARTYYAMEMAHCGALLHINSNIINKKRVKEIIATCKMWLETL